MNNEELFSTPMMKQYYDIKKDYKDCLLFFRMGDFYELFLDDAKIGAQVLDITLTGKKVGKDKRIPMAGVPFHAVDSYLSKLVKAGHKVAICEQVSEPTKYGIVDREVIRIVTPGTVMDEKTLHRKENNYIISLTFDEKKLGIAVADVSTGQFQTAEFHLGIAGNKEHIIMNELARIAPAECILHVNHYNDPQLLRLLKHQKDLNIFCFQAWDTFAQQADKTIKNHFHLTNVNAFDLQDKKHALQASAALLGYLKDTQKDNIGHFKAIQTYSTDGHMLLDRSTIMNLELFCTIRQGEKKGSLISILDETNTAMGGRMLREWIRKPLRDTVSIKNRHEAVQELVENQSTRSQVREHLTEISDIERTLARLAVGIGNARDIVNLKNALKIATTLRDSSTFKSSLLKQLQHSIDHEITTIIEHIEKHLVEEPPFDTREGGMIQTGIDKNLDILRAEINGNKDWIASMEQEERARTGIASLKVKFNKVFGFYIEISKANLHLVPADYMRKQTLVNGERFITPELKIKEELILTAEEKMCEIEYRLFKEILSYVLGKTSIIQTAAQNIAAIDCIGNFAHIAEKYDYCKPKLIKTGEISIKNGRHPVVEQLLHESQFVPNDTELNNDSKQLIMITGPNMAGKSVYIRQVAVIALMNQIGSFVPAKSAELTIVDRIFVRSGASDAITEGLSTFMVEMVETAQILNHATDKSLIIMDEIGRGTSTYDGISIAWAIAEYLVTHENQAAKTLFATHYHELQELEKQYPHKIANYHMAIEEHKGEPIFLHTLAKGGASHSFGVAVAKLAGVPEAVVHKAQALLHQLENRNVDTSSSHTQADNSPILQKLQHLNVYNITPLEALNKLAELKSLLKE